MNNNSFIYNKQMFVTGDKVQCTIRGHMIRDAKVYVISDKELEWYPALLCDPCRESNVFFICQNSEDGSESPDKLGYRYSYITFINIDGKIDGNVEYLVNLNYSHINRSVGDIVNETIHLPDKHKQDLMSFKHYVKMMNLKIIGEI